ncbi:MAG: C39 family peptidase [Anaerolineales bacterium]|jgi:tetratricopeptide (TPR) repeat protein
MQAGYRPRRRFLATLVLVLLVFDLFLAFELPQIQEHLSWRIEVYEAEVRQFLRPHPQTLSTPEPQAAAMGPAASIDLATTATEPPRAQLSPSSPRPSPSPTMTSVPLPLKVMLTPPRHEYQLFNNCGPATLSMTLRYWGWQGSQRDTAAILKPVQDDRNVMPYEMVAYVQNHTQLQALLRYAGTLDDLKRLIAAGFPPVVEKGFNVIENNLGWMGHYNLLTGYDDSRRVFIAQDSYEGPNFPVDYDTLLTNWRAFNFLYIVVFPPDREQDVLSVLGPNADEGYNDQLAVQHARQEVQTLSGKDLAFAWFDLGTSLVTVRDYGPASYAFDQARYAGLPWRMLWYQTGPYFAYFYTGRYQDVIDLANETLDQQEYLEESWYWRGMAKIALGDLRGGADDLRTALSKHPGFPPALAELQQLGLKP